MNPMILGSIFEIGKTLIDRFFPDPEKKREAEMEMVKLAAAGELQQVVAQLEINAREAQHPSIWVAGWRPAFGWIGALGFLYATVIQPILVWIGVARGWPAPPDVNVELLWVVTTGLLGIGGMRSFEKYTKVSK